MIGFNSDVSHSLWAGNSPCWPLLVEGFNELIQEGLAPSNDMLRENDRALYIHSPDGDIVAALAYVFEDLTKEAIIKIAYVEPSSRRLGYFRTLWNELTVRASNAGCHCISLKVAAHDSAAITVFTKPSIGAQTQALWLTRALRK